MKKSARGTGAGRILVQELLQHIKENRGKAGEYAEVNALDGVVVVANSQAYAEGFYRKLDFVREGETFLEVTLSHYSGPGGRSVPQRRLWGALLLFTARRDLGKVVRYSATFADCFRAQDGADHVRMTRLIKLDPLQ